METQTFNTAKDFAGFTIPAHHTAEFFDSKGNLIAHFDQPRHYDKVDDSGHHTYKFSHEFYLFPLTVKFTEHEPRENEDSSF